MRQIAIFLLTASASISCSGLGESDLPEAAEPAAGLLDSAGTSNTIWRELEDIQGRYAPPAWRCSQFMYDMMDLAERAETQIPEVVELIRVGAHPGDVNFLLMLMGERALLVAPDLLELADAPDPVVRERALAALAVTFEAATRQEKDQGCAVAEPEQGAAEQDVAAAEAPS